MTDSQAYMVLTSTWSMWVRVMGHGSIAAALLACWFMGRNRLYKRDGGDIIRLMFYHVDSSILTLGLLFALYTVIPFFPFIIPYALPMSLLAGSVLWGALIGLWQMRKAIVKALA